MQCSKDFTQNYATQKAKYRKNNCSCRAAKNILRIMPLRRAEVRGTAAHAEEQIVYTELCLSKRQNLGSTTAHPEQQRVFTELCLSEGQSLGSSTAHPEQHKVYTELCLSEGNNLRSTTAHQEHQSMSINLRIYLLGGQIKGHYALAEVL